MSVKTAFVLSFYAPVSLAIVFIIGGILHFDGQAAILVLPFSLVVLFAAPCATVIDGYFAFTQRSSIKTCLSFAVLGLVNLSIIIALLAGAFAKF